MANEKKCEIAEVLSDAGYEHHETVLGFNVWRRKEAYVVWHPSPESLRGNAGGVQLMYIGSQYSKEICERDLKKKKFV